MSCGLVAGECSGLGSTLKATLAQRFMRRKIRGPASFTSGSTKRKGSRRRCRSSPLARRPADRLACGSSATLKSISSEKRLMSSQPFESEVPPEKADAISPRSTWPPMTPRARTTCQSFSTRPGDVPRSLATSSTSRRSSTLETQADVPVADIAANAAIDAHDAPGGHLCCASRVVVPLEAARQRFDADPAQSCLQRAEAADRHRLAACQRWPGARRKPLPDFDKTPSRTSPRSAQPT